MNIGAGRIVYQDLAKINNDIFDNKLEKNPKLNELLEKAINKNKTLNIMGLLSDGGFIRI